MPKLAFALEAGGDKRLVVSWKGLYKDVTVSRDGNPVGVIPNQKGLSAGQEFPLPDSSTIKVQLVNRFLTTELHVLRNGQPLPGSSSDLQTRHKTAYGMVYLVAGINLVLGLVAVLFNVQFLQQLGVGIYSMIIGLINLVFAFFTQRKSVVALVLAILLFALDGILNVIFAPSPGFNPGMAGYVARIFCLYR